MESDSMMGCSSLIGVESSEVEGKLPSESVKDGDEDVSVRLGAS